MFLVTTLLTPTDFEQFYERLTKNFFQQINMVSRGSFRVCLKIISKGSNWLVSAALCLSYSGIQPFKGSF